MFYCLYYSVTINESTEMFTIAFYCSLVNKNIVAAPSSFVIFCEVSLLRNSCICLS